MKLFLSTRFPENSTTPTKRPHYIQLEGLRLTSEFRAAEVRQALAFEPQRGDVILVAYPKCGSHWVQQLIQLVVSGGDSAPHFFEFTRRMPLIELLGTDLLEGVPPPRLLRTHLPLARVRFSEDAKYVYVARNPWDCCVSFYHHTKMLPAAEYQDGTFDDFFELFVNGETDHGDFFDHVLPWYDLRKNENVLFLTYEQLKKDPRSTILELARFMGEDYERQLLEDDAVFDNVLAKSSVLFMKERYAFSLSQFREIIEKDPDSMPEPLKVLFSERTFVSEVEEKNKVNFVRKGIVGGYGTHLTGDHLQRMKVWIERKTGGSDVMKLWKDVSDKLLTS